MYKCFDCGEIFEVPTEWEERHNLDTPPYEHREGCPCCQGGFEEYTEEDAINE